MDRISKCILACVAAAGISALTYTEGFAQEPAATEPVCDTTVKIDAYLRDKGFAEASFGIINPKTALLIYSQPGGKAWVAVLIGTDGKACFSFEGLEWWPGAVQPEPVPGERAA